jgi:acetyl esterase/lipase
MGPYPARAWYDEARWSVRVTDNVVYGQGRVDGGVTWKDLLLTLYEPVDNPDPLKPGVVFIHGGGFVGGSRTSMDSWGRVFAARGYVAVSIDYRLLGEDPVADPAYVWWPINPELAPAVHAATVDGARAVRYLRANAETLGIDKNFIFAGGISAGGITVGNLAVAGPEGAEAYRTELPGDVPLPINNPQESSLVQAVLDFCGGAGPGVPDPSDAPMLLVHTDADPVVPVLLPDVINDWYVAAPAPIEYYRLAGGSHCSFLGGGTIDGLNIFDLSARFLDRMVWDRPAEPMVARKLLLKDSSSAPDRRKLVFAGSPDPSGTSQALATPAVGSAEDPSLHGMIAEIYASTGDPGDYVRVHLPAEGWTARTSSRGVKYLYSDRRGEHGPVQRVRLQPGKFLLVGRGEALPGLGGAPHGGFSVRVRFADSAPWCASTGAGRSDSDRRYIADPQVYALPCVDRPAP